MPTYSDTLSFLDSFINYERTGMDSSERAFDLDKLREVLKKAGDPHENYHSVHVTGTKGKGSVCSFVSSVLKEAGYRVGLFTSPHLLTVRERIQTDGEFISEEDFVSALEHIKKYLDSSGPRGRFTYFEILTLMAMAHFSIKKCDYAVFEVGMGGRFDATNVINADVCGISPISYDHTHVLGSTIEMITKEKAEIIKKKTRCVSSPQEEAALEIIRDKCAEEEAALSVVGKDITYRPLEMDESGSLFDIAGKKGSYKECRTNMPGAFQLSNCATAVGICEELLEGKGGIDGKTVKRGIERAFIPGRMEVLSRRPLVVIDGAQNGESAKRLRDSVEKIFKYNKLVLILGVSRDKDIKNICGHLTPMADEVILTKASVERAADPLLLRGSVKGKDVKVTGDVKEALGIAFGKAGAGDMILATGSFFVIGEVRRLILDNR
ncbi:MAG: folylpolyglutamate synthase/dihydrofolate synthase family protein [Candidatus Omnitrophota bacterium]